MGQNTGKWIQNNERTTEDVITEETQNESPQEDAGEATGAQNGGEPGKRRKARATQVEHRKVQDEWTCKFDLFFTGLTHCA